MKKYPFVVLLIYLGLNCNAQSKISPEQFKSNEAELFQNAINLNSAGQYDSAILLHKEIYKKNPTHKRNTYEIARNYGLKENKDSCLKYLNLSNFKSLSLRILTASEFYFLHKDTAWNTIRNKVLANNKWIVKQIKDLDYAKELWSLGAADQAYYTELKLAEKEYGHDAKEVKNIWKKKEKINKENQQKLEALIAEKGYPKRSEVGPEATQSAFLVIQHSDLDKMKKYIREIKKECFEEGSNCQAYALIFDRISVSQNKPQRYGTQIQYNKEKKEYELSPLENEGLINEYREHMSLGPIEKYAANWNIELDLNIERRPFAYADSIVKITLGKDSPHNYFYGAHIRPPFERNIPIDPKKILGNNKEYSLALPRGTEIIVAFTDNQIVDYPDQADIFIKEYSGASEKAIAYVSHDGIKFDSLGITYSGRASSLDLKTINYSKSVRYIKMRALDSKGSVPGYDLVYLKGLPGSSIDASMTEPQIDKYLSLARKELDKLVEPVAQKTKKIVNPKPMEKPTTDALILEEIKFDSRSAKIQKASLPYLNKLSEQLKSGTWRTLELTGHTDDQGTEISNEELSLERARAIKKYLIQHGVPDKDIRCFGQGATQPIMSNETKDGRAENRRVELRIID